MFVIEEYGNFTIKNIKLLNKFIDRKRGRLIQRRYISTAVSIPFLFKN